MFICDHSQQMETTISGYLELKQRHAVQNESKYYDKAERWIAYLTVAESFHSQCKGNPLPPFPFPYTSDPLTGWIIKHIRLYLY